MSDYVNVQVPADAIFATSIATGEKDSEGKPVRRRWTATAEEMAGMHPSVIGYILDAGLGRVHAVKLNEVKIDNGEKAAAFDALWTEMLSGAKPDLFTRAVRGPAAGIDPVEAEAFKLAEADIFAALGIKSRAAALDHDAAKKYYFASGNAAKMNVDAFRTFIERNPAGDYMERAKRIVDGRKAVAVDVKI